MNKVVQALKLIEKFELALFDFVDACHDIQDLKLTDSECVELQKRYQDEHGLEIPENAQLYGRDYQDADYNMRQLFEAREAQEQSNDDERT